MAERHPRFLADLPHRVREHLHALPDRVRTWHAELRAAPTAPLHSPMVRYAGLLVLLIAGGGMLAYLSSALTPKLVPGFFEEATPTATLFVACTNPDCLAHAIVKQPRDFKGWPLTCEKCRQTTVYRARRCPTCGGWFAVAPGRAPNCPLCERAARARETAPSDPKPDRPEDPEDWW